MSHINQHYNNAEALERCIDLKNALEFVGLKNFYLSDVTKEAQAAILNMTIKEQEATAIKVIEEEHIISGIIQGTAEI